ncbi:hypothetical protein BPTFM16_00947 [Altererythrobacter insulae]|nr:hypothetical protein BPTFM16_00947 [Altererythrobacter insulae]
MKRCVLFSALAISVAVPASAQLDPEAATGSRFLQDPATLDPDLVRQMTKDFGECLYDGREKQSDALLAASDYLAIDYENIGDASKMLSDRKFLNFCLGRAMTVRQRKVGMTISNKAIRTALVEAAYLDQYRDRDEPIELPESAPEVLPNRFFVEGESVDDARAIASFSDCIVLNAPKEAHVIVHTDPASKEERAAINEIVPALGGCLPSGREMELTLESIRAMVADGLWARSYYGPMLAESENAAS